MSRPVGSVAGRWFAPCLLAVGAAHGQVLDFQMDKDAVSVDRRPAQRSSAIAAAQVAAVVGARVRSVSVTGWWNRGTDTGLEECELLTSDRLFDAMEMLDDGITASRAATVDMGIDDQVEVTFIRVEPDPAPQAPCPGPERTVGIVFRPYHVRLARSRLGDNVLPLPRLPFGSVAANVPAPLRALNPTVEASYDRAFGSAIAAGAHGDLFAPAAMRDQHLDASGQLTQSTREAFHRNDLALAYRIDAPSTMVDQIRLKADRQASREPLVDDEQSRRALTMHLGITLRPRRNARLYFDGGWQKSSDTLRDNTTVIERTRANRYASRLMGDLTAPETGQFVRAGVWHDATRAGEAGNHRRLAAQVAYSRETVSPPATAVGIEVMAGAGHIQGTAPATDLFYGGNRPTQFLYEAPDAATMLQMPSGPLLRSFGQRQATGDSRRGGRGYWHVNATLALPVSGWSRPLIPAEPVGLKLGDEDLTVKDILRKQVDVSGPAMLAATLSAQGAAFDDAQRQAEAAFAEIGPAAHYVIDKADLFAIRPLLMVDVASLQTDGERNARWVAAGAGVGITVVTARFEAGYMVTVSGPRTTSGRGAAFARLIFSKWF